MVLRPNVSSSAIDIKFIRSRAECQVAYFTGRIHPNNPSSCGDCLNHIARLNLVANPLMLVL